MKMQCFSVGVTGLDKVRNDNIIENIQVSRIGERWYGSVQRKDEGNTGKRKLRMALPGNRKMGRSKSLGEDIILKE